MIRKTIFFLGCLTSVAGAQDTRVVTEPKVPPVCTRLMAQLQKLPSVDGGTLRAEDETRLDTRRIQAALDGCKPGMAVELSGKGAMSAYLSGPLDLREGVTLLVDKGVTVFGSRDPQVFEMAKEGETPRCGTSMPRPATLPVFALGARPSGGCRALINVRGARNAAVMGEGTLDGRGYARLLGKNYSWWEMARRAQPNDDLYYSTKLVTADHADGFVLYGIHLVNSANYHVVVGGTDGFTAWGVHLNTPVNKALVGTGNDARNTDGIDPGTSENITVAYSWIDNGDDNIAVKQGVSHMSVLHNHFYDGHGMSIGSETVLGQSFLVVDDLTEDHTSSGIRIKSNVKRGGPVHDLIYKDVCMRGVPIPIAISPYYTNQTVEPFEDPKYQGDRIPDYKGIVLEDVESETPGDVLIAGLNDQHRTQVTLNDVSVRGITAQQVHLAYADLTVPACQARGWPKTNLPLGTVPPTVKVLSGEGAACGVETVLKPDPCAGRFVPMQ